MDGIALFTSQGLYFIFKWIHFLAGVAWIGLLWYINFIQGSFFAETDADTKKKATQQLVPRVLWWFRWGAMFTFLSGWCMIIHQIINGATLSSGQWLAIILGGGLLGSLMWFNVWFVIWPAQKVVIASAKGETTENPAPRAARGLLASRTNTLLSIPMLFLMGAARNLSISFDVTSAEAHTFLGVILGILAIVEINALTATPESATFKPIKTVKGVITSGFVLCLVIYVLLETLL
ncbi:urate hydroxylase PuuD [Leptospira noguchii]|uniref:PF06181 domain protein n=1 Tax=Leptospira noguchii serovar Autumnalis str. ZUN142 TaxID=1085540 RepID=M6UCM3_9LEPT|nr:urate hydroxylase PuuD [Leptospira noguchii]EMO27663.1 PF06181 domain protein [Leptospira interrogans serovar Bataviae str. HAI135]EMO40576.1 PF06181 domain protein [Leptospira noguchii serovar Autumnalis str. ZUN142]EMS87041.1 PF06181 domain protein [Leptospira noguchii str. Cascata]EMS87967.1 PF06181 domain protein [Leptospira noguchii str. Hook]UOG41577.1 urate hydroxylase PuuD [Leptospira noguchii]